jgi:hypothetical protein
MQARPEIANGPFHFVSAPTRSFRCAAFKGSRMSDDQAVQNPGRPAEKTQSGSLRGIAGVIAFSD